MKKSYIQQHFGITQEEWAIKQLKENGCVTRNQALGLMFSRLGAVICSLNQAGWDIKGEDMPSGDYKYTLLEPKKIVKWEFDLVDGQRVPRKTLVAV